ncbi:hypothetical protein QOT17_008104 [Balamuthia mandrillaris]
MNSAGVAPAAASLFHLLPNEVLLHIFRFLPPSDLLNVHSVSSTFCAVASDEQLWNELFLHQFGPLDASHNNFSSWKELFKHLGFVERGEVRYTLSSREAHAAPKPVVFWQQHQPPRPGGPLVVEDTQLRLHEFTLSFWIYHAMVQPNEPIPLVYIEGKRASLSVVMGARTANALSVCANKGKPKPKEGGATSSANERRKWLSLMESSQTLPPLEWTHVLLRCCRSSSFKSSTQKEEETEHKDGDEAATTEAVHSYEEMEGEEEEAAVSSNSKKDDETYHLVLYFDGVIVASSRLHKSIFSKEREDTHNEEDENEEMDSIRGELLSRFDDIANDDILALLAMIGRRRRGGPERRRPLSLFSGFEVQLPLPFIQPQTMEEEEPAEEDEESEGDQEVEEQREEEQAGSQVETYHLDGHLDSVLYYGGRALARNEMQQLFRLVPPPPSDAEEVRGRFEQRVTGVRHNGYQCDGCDVIPITGLRYRCFKRCNFGMPSFLSSLLFRSRQEIYPLLNSSWLDLCHTCFTEGKNPVGKIFFSLHSSLLACLHFSLVSFSILSSCTAPAVAPGHEASHEWFKVFLHGRKGYNKKLGSSTSSSSSPPSPHHYASLFCIKE